MKGLLVDFFKIDTDEVFVNLVSEKTIKDLHLEFFNDPTITDSISMPIDGLDESASRPRVLGEIFACPLKAVLYAQEKGLDPFEETSLYIVHGLLHLLGHDDIETKDRRKMRYLEKKSLNFLKSKNLLLKPSKK